jgi:DNA ligase (NAD+)
MQNINELQKQLVKDPIKYSKNLSIDELVDLLEMLSDAYYNTGEPIVSDEIYDKLFDDLKKRDPDNKYLKNVGASIKGTKELVKLPFEMGSLTKIKPSGEDLNKWTNKFKGPYFLSDKEDGVSAQIYKNQAGEIFMYSRGDGIEGQNISHLLQFIISKKILKKIPNGSSIRGELIISKDNFKKIDKLMKNARNAVAGLVNAKNFNKDIAKITDFVAYAILNPRYHFKEQIELLNEYGFNVVKNKSINKLTEEYLKSYLTERRKESEYEMDGIVIVDDSKIYSHSGGYPEHSFAFKMLLDDQIAITKVIEVIWDPSKDGYLKPKIKIEPVDLLGTTVTYATAFNAKFIVDNKIGPGAKIKIVRSGDVIPYILEVVKAAKEGPSLPEFPYKWNSTNVDLILKDENDANGKQIVTIKLLIHFFSTIGVKYLSEGIITKLVENGYNSVAEILKADKKKLYKIDGLGEKIVDKIYDEIDRAFDEVSLDIFMGASNKLGRNLGTRKIKEIITIYPDILKESEDDEDELYEKIIKVPGFSEKLSEQFSENFKNFKKFYNEIAKIKDLSRFEKIEIKKIDGVFSGKSIVFTGFRDKNLEKFILDNGGKISESISGNTFMLVYADDADTGSSKFVKAKEKEVKIIKKSDFVKDYVNKK